MKVDHSMQDWAETGIQAFEPILPLHSTQLIILSLRGAVLTACHTTTPMDTSAFPLTWQPFSFDSLEDRAARKIGIAIILLPSVVTASKAQPKLLECAWAALQRGDTLVIGSVNASLFKSYRVYHRLRKLAAGARAYACLGRSNPSTLLRLVSCRHDMQRHHVRHTGHTRIFLRDVVACLTSMVGVYPWLAEEHLLVAEKC